MKRITIEDIARECNVSKSTVSRVLNNSPHVKSSTRKKVLEVMKKYNYTPNILARGLIAKKIGALGVIVSDITNPFHSLLVRGIGDICRTYGYSLFLCNTDGRVDEEIKHVRSLIQRSVDGIIFASIKLKDEGLEEAKKSGIPILLVGRLPEKEEGFNYVIVDNELGGYMAVNYLISLGHRKIAYLSGPWDTWPNIRRFEGYKRALEEAGLSIDKKYIFKGDFTLDTAYSIGTKILMMRDRPTSVFCANDMSAIGLLEACMELGVKVPEEMSIIGFDDIPLSSFRTIQLTTVSQSIYDQGALAGKILLEKLQNEDNTPTQLTLPPKLIIRKTCAPPKEV